MKSLSTFIIESLNRGHLVYSLEDVNSVLLDRKDIENEWEAWLQELNTKLTKLASHNIGNTPKSLVTRWKTFQSNLSRFHVDKYSKIQNLIAKIPNGEATTELQDEIDEMNNTFKYFLSELRALVKSKREVSVNGRISSKNYLIVLRGLFEKPFIVSSDEVNMEMESSFDTIMKLAVVCCGDIKTIDEYTTKFGDPLK